MDPFSEILGISIFERAYADFIAHSNQLGDQFSGLLEGEHSRVSTVANPTAMRKKPAQRTAETQRVSIPLFLGEHFNPFRNFVRFAFDMSQTGLPTCGMDCIVRGIGVGDQMSAEGGAEN